MLSDDKEATNDIKKYLKDIHISEVCLNYY